MAVPMSQVLLAGSDLNLIIVVFAVVVIGGMNSIIGSIITGLRLGVIEGLIRVLYPESFGNPGVHLDSNCPNDSAD